MRITKTEHIPLANIDLLFFRTRLAPPKYVRSHVESNEESKRRGKDDLAACKLNKKLCGEDNMVPRIPVINYNIYRD